MVRSRYYTKENSNKEIYNRLINGFKRLEKYREITNLQRKRQEKRYHEKLKNEQFEHRISKSLKKLNKAKYTLDTKQIVSS